jgi:hypothetical protein
VVEAEYRRLGFKFQLAGAGGVGLVPIKLPHKFSHTVLVLKSRYYLDGENATLMPVVDNIRILAYKKAKDN